eukprot:TRINITY_DN25130_c0_g1_i1.p2 TRINITY_DN25130_c0_g1~~TRINITY_DN25130_c0_g1_i1.p2  ORF type:complete len:120 (-),score=14.29 TRINITY_DN25130_c0_g1_i1:288-647(-)
MCRLWAAWAAGVCAAGGVFAVPGVVVLGQQRVVCVVLWGHRSKERQAGRQAPQVCCLQSCSKQTREKQGMERNEVEGNIIMTPTTRCCPARRLRVAPCIEGGGSSVYQPSPPVQGMCMQ